MPTDEVIFSQSPRLNLARLTFSELQFVKNGGFTSRIETDHKDSHFLLAEL
jgi:hypothetical protein